MSPALLGVIACLLLSGLFSGVETAFTSLTVFQLESMRKRGGAGALAARLAKRPEQLIATILIGNNLVNILSSVLATGWVLERFGDRALAVMTGVLTFIVLVFGEVTPKRIAINHNELVAKSLAPLVLACSILFSPAVWLVNGLSSMLTRFFRRPAQSAVSIDTVAQMVSMAEHLGIIDYSRTLMLRNVLRINSTSVHAIMTHRIEVFSLDQDISCDEACRLVMSSEHSRIPVYGDGPENIRGVVTLHAILNEVLAGRGESKLASLAQPALFIMATKPVSQLFGLFKERKETFAVVMDEYGGLAGIVSMRDVVEEIVGEIYEAQDEESRDRIGQAEDGSLLLAGDTPMSQVAELADRELDDSLPVQTLSGYVAWALDRIPVPGDRLETGLGRFHVVEVASNRAAQIQFYRPSDGG